MKIRILVLGGAGYMGKVAAYVLAKHGKAEVQVTDRTEEKARKAADEVNKRIGSVLVKSEAINVENKDDLRRSMRDADVVVNCVGPYYKYGLNTIKTAIEVGVKYADICDELVAAQEIVKLDEDAKNAKTTILTSLGSSPGLSNIQVQYSAKRMDSVSDVHIAWTSSQTDPFGPSVMKHCLHCYSSPHQFIAGQLVQVPTFSGRQLVEFPEPVGKVDVVYFDHPEVLTIPMYVKGIKNVTVRGGIFPGDIHDLIESWVKAGASLMDDYDVDGTRVAAVDFLASVAMKIMQSKKDLPAVSAQKIEVFGKVGGENVTHVHASVGTMASGTILPLFIATMMLGEGKINDYGVLPPDAIDPDLFFEEFKKRRGVEYTQVGGMFDFRKAS
ncbi:MAG TPA: saccharopine dehydrogenase NADP-binding domain-containing protein [Candidatus Bathyarchaeia archaeon]|nr:saccharopine dehydrogenase NADP-binding domain-containing protein [Candidatus Bathyarchaeia archaeon]